MTDLFGFTRTVVKGRYALITPDGFVPSNLPGWKNAVAVVNISPALGARFVQMHVTLAKDGVGEGNTGAHQYFIYALAGAGTILFEGRRHRLEPGSYAYLPAGTDLQVRTTGPDLQLLVFQKTYEPLSGFDMPDALVGHERDIKGRPFPGNAEGGLQVLLPEIPDFDLAVNILTCQPGAALPSVATPIMEQGLFMLQGQGIYRLDVDYHPVQAGDVIWLAPYCPQWFVAMGKTPASYIYYQDVNRNPM